VADSHGDGQIDVCGLHCFMVAWFIDEVSATIAEPI